MYRTIRRLPGYSLMIMASAAALVGCAGEGSLSPDRQASAEFAPVASLAQGPDLGSCGDLQPPAGNQLTVRLYAEGDQIYRWDGTTWNFVAPSAVLFADPEHQSRVGTHYAGPKWESVSGSVVQAAIDKRCTPDANAIQWLLLRAVSTTGPGMFDGVTFIQRINTVAGTAPSYPGNTVGELAYMPYQTEYLFYRGQ